CARDLGGTYYYVSSLDVW
nr:immunoglobulin heavy chain junction region [Macaca mulatta]MOV44259.1 immunoglobulin heavy chain junction region [Macaca mulatta]